ncbi:hypothetical protein BV22DRAFT_1198393 [Leucogyrophana mollusca]|uniref:Uncharacterized protein n=1 Tax=Leucogyrophana mollusca TaxID=85980 RepID=A0ACB8B8E8_9AGAM|nr:hypothetical protein BV22DRAFT_1198393 [Leucogyrophana mollusca]
MMSATSTQSTSSRETTKKIAGYPFDSPAADIILRSSDGVDFRVSKLLLSMVSPVFSDMLAMPQPQVAKENDFKDGLPVVLLAETESILEKVLLICYPSYLGGVGKLVDLDEWELVTEAAGKYQMEAAVQHILAELEKSSFVKSDPLRVFALAVRFQAAQTARTAARNSLPLNPLSVGQYPDILGLRKISGADLYHLLKYQSACGEAASDAMKAWHLQNISTSLWVWSREKASFDFDFPVDPCCTRATLFGVQSAAWWTKYAKETYYALKEQPTRETVQNADLTTKALRQAGKCSRCSREAALDMARFTAHMADLVDQAVSKIVLELEFEKGGDQTTSL